jgi:hypothetical protein
MRSTPKDATAAVPEVLEGRRENVNVTMLLTGAA